MPLTRRFVVDGRVQGVCFRAFTQDEARRLNLRGFVRNLPDGRVEALAQGEETALRAFADFLNHGSPYARVQSVASGDVDDAETFDDFHIRR